METEDRKKHIIKDSETGEEFYMDTKPELWIKAFSDYEDSREVTCPICNGSSVKVTAVCGDDLIGFISFACYGCKTFSHFSRVRFKRKRDGMKSFISCKKGIEWGFEK